MAERLYIVGHPVAHSKSPAMHNAAYRALGLDWEYGFMDCPSSEEARSFFEREGWLAVNVTMPHKPIAFASATRRTEAAVLARGANVLVRTGDGLFADNTDGVGCVSYLQRRGVCFGGASVVVCGTGPTSLAIMHAATLAGAARVSLLSRDASRARQALEAYRARLEGAPATSLEASSYESASDVLAAADVIVDATSLGMKPGDPAPFDTRILSADQAVFDVVYGHGETVLAAAARQAGCAFYDGAGMLVAQAVETVVDIQRETGAFVIPENLDLFEIMAEAAGFTL